MSNYKVGIDISNNDGSIDMGKVATNGVQYVYVKATEGQSFKDSYMDKFYNDCKANNFKVGAYHFLVGTSSPEAQAQNFYTTIKDYEWDCIPMMDIETNFNGLSNYVIRFINTFKQLSPLQLGIYSYTSFINYIEDISDKIKDMPFWEANYNNKPWSLNNNFFTNRIGHQYTETGKIDGINCNCDVNSFTEGVLLNDITIAGKWINQNSKWWYKHEDGSYTSNNWEKIDSKWYHFNYEGWMEYDWKKDGNSWYLLGNSNDGSMKTGWVLTDKKWYYLDLETGAMTIGWKKISDKWYYFNTDGSMANGWIKDGGKDYCLYSSGEMIHDIDLYGYHFASDGSAIKL